MIGTTILHHKILAKLGEGGMGRLIITTTVYPIVLQFNQIICLIWTTQQN